MNWIYTGLLVNKSQLLSKPVPCSYLQFCVKTDLTYIWQHINFFNGCLKRPWISLKPSTSLLCFWIYWSIIFPVFFMHLCSMYLLDSIHLFLCTGFRAMCTVHRNPLINYYLLRWQVKVKRKSKETRERNTLLFYHKSRPTIFGR